MIKEKLKALPRPMKAGIFLVIPPLTLFMVGFTLSLNEALTFVAVLTTVLLVAVLLRTASRVSASLTIRLMALPTGLYVATLSLVKAIESNLGFSGIFTAVIASGILLLTSMNEKIDEDNLTKETPTYNLAAALVIGLPIAIIAVLPPYDWLSMLWQPAVIIIVISSFCAIYFLQDNSKAFSERLIFAGAYNIVFQSVCAVMVFVWQVQLDLGDKFTTALSSVATLILYPLILYLITIIYTVSKGEVSDRRKIDITNWHIVEGFIFFMAMVVAPPSIIEFILSQKN